MMEESMKLVIKNQEIQRINKAPDFIFPKYTSQIINLANQNAQGTRPRVVGQLSDLFPMFQNEVNDINMCGWEEWYLEHHPNAISIATDRIFNQIANLQKAIKLITRDMVENWVKDLVITKTYNGFYFQEAILYAVAQKLHTTYRTSQPQEESRGIDGFIGEVPYSIKPETYKTMNRLPEEIGIKMIFYKKTKTGLTLEIDD
jgi:hypothetical protein